MMNSDTPGWRTDFDRELTAARLALLLGVLLFVSYPDIMAGTHAFFYRDAGQFGFPVASYLRDCFWRGEVPLWNPYNNCGLPFLAQWNTLALYPPSLFYELLPMPWAMNFFILGHVFLAGLGMYFLALRWFGNRFAASFAGLVFAWNGLALNCWMWPCHIAALGWMPWVVLLAERAWHGGKRPMVWAALAGACQMATGSPEIIFFTWLIVARNFPGRGLAATPRCCLGRGGAAGRGCRAGRGPERGATSALAGFAGARRPHRRRRRQHLGHAGVGRGQFSRPALPHDRIGRRRLDATRAGMDDFLLRGHPHAAAGLAGGAEDPQCQDDSVPRSYGRGGRALRDGRFRFCP
jgi:hypothetical protein